MKVDIVVKYLLFILFLVVLSLFVYSNVESMDESLGVSVRNLALLNNKLTPLKSNCSNSTAILNDIKNLGLQSPYFNYIFRDYQLSDYGKLIYIKELLNFINSKSVVSKDNAQSVFNQIVVLNKPGKVTDRLTVEMVVMMYDILQKTTLQNAGDSIMAIDDLLENGTQLKSILYVNELSNYNKIVVLKSVLYPLFKNARIHGLVKQTGIEGMREYDVSVYDSMEQVISGDTTIAPAPQPTTLRSTPVSTTPAPTIPQTAAPTIPPTAAPTTPMTTTPIPTCPSNYSPSAYKTVVDTINGITDAITAQVKAYTDNSNQLKQIDITTLKNNINDANANLGKQNTLSQNYNDAKAASDKANADAKTALSNYNAANASLQDAQNKLNAATASLQTPQTNLQNAKVFLDATKNNLNTENNNLNTAKNSLNTANSNLNTATSKYNPAKNDLDSVTNTLKNDQGALDTAVNNVKTLTNQISSIMPEYAGKNVYDLPPQPGWASSWDMFTMQLDPKTMFNPPLRAIANQIKMGKLPYDQLVTTVNADKNYQQNKQNALDKVTPDYNNATNAVKTATTAVNTATDKVKSATDEVNTAQTKFNDANTTYNTAANAVNLAKNDANDAQTKFNAANTTYNNAKTAADNAQSKLNSIQNPQPNITDLNKTIDTLNTQLSTQSTAYKTYANNANAAYDSINTNNGYLQAAGNTLKDFIRNANKFPGCAVNNYADPSPTPYQISSLTKYQT